jgi:hypothetical protein
MTFEYPYEKPILSLDIPMSDCIEVSLHIGLTSDHILEHVTIILHCLM